MKTLICLLALCVSATALAATTPLSDTACSTASVCFTPAAGIDYVSVNATYGRVVASVNGVVYDSGLYAVPIVVAPAYTVTATLYGPGTAAATFTADFHHWTTRVGSGHPFYVQHYELLGGTLVTP